MSKEQSPPVRNVVPYKPGKRISTFRRLNLDFAGTALEQALAESTRQPDSTLQQEQQQDQPEQELQPPSPAVPETIEELPHTPLAADSAASSPNNASLNLDGQPGRMAVQPYQMDGSPYRLDGEPPVSAVQPPPVYGEPYRPAVQTANPAALPYSHTAAQPPGRPDSQTYIRPDVQPYSQKQDADYASRYGKYKVTVRLPEDKILRIKAWCAQNRRDLQDVIEEALDIWTASRQAVRPDSQPDGQTAHDHDIDDYLDKLIEDDPLTVYRKLTRNSILQRDREAWQEVAGLDPTVVKFGIGTSIERSKNRINSFRYCVPAIREVAQKYNNHVDTDYFRYLVYRLLNTNKVLPGG